MSTNLFHLSRADAFYHYNNEMLTASPIPIQRNVQQQNGDWQGKLILIIFVLSNNVNDLIETVVSYQTSFSRAQFYHFQHAKNSLTVSSTLMPSGYQYLSQQQKHNNDIEKEHDILKLFKRLCKQSRCDLYTSLSQFIRKQRETQLKDLHSCTKCV